MNKNILITVLALIVVIMGIVLFFNKGNLSLPTVNNNDGIIINVNDEDKAGVDNKDGSVRTPPALPN